MLAAIDCQKSANSFWDSKTTKSTYQSDGKTMIRETSDQLDSKVSHQPEAKLSVSSKEMQDFIRTEMPKSHSSGTHTSQFLDMGSADHLYGSKSAHESGKSAHASVLHMSEQQFDLGKAVQDWVGSAIDAGKHALEGLGKEAPKAAPEEREPPEEIKVFDPKVHGVGPIWSIDDFEKWLKNNEDNPDIIIYPKDDPPFPDCDPGFKLPMDRKGAPEIDRGFQIPSDRTTRKVTKEDSFWDGSKERNARNEAIEEVLAATR
ncbi:hypothetical protein BH10CYA1_BH10CYA1_36640 [soil metagenome]